jgi:hypothetical protein
MLVDMNCLDGRLLSLSCARLPINRAAPERFDMVGWVAKVACVR